MEDPLTRIRRMCLALPEVEERLSHGHPAWFVRRGRQVASFHDRHHDQRVAVWCAARLDAQEAYTTFDPERYFRPPYVGHRGWIGVCLDGDVDWDEVRALLVEAYRSVAPERLRQALDAAERNRDSEPS